MIWATLSPQIASLGLERDSGGEGVGHDLPCYDSYDPGHYRVSHNMSLHLVGWESSVPIEDKHTHTHTRMHTHTRTHTRTHTHTCTHAHAQISYHHTTAYWCPTTCTSGGGQHTPCALLLYTSVTVPCNKDIWEEFVPPQLVAVASTE